MHKAVYRKTNLTHVPPLADISPEEQVPQLVGLLVVETAGHLAEGQTRQAAEVAAALVDILVMAVLVVVNNTQKLRPQVQAAEVAAVLALEQTIVVHVELVDQPHRVLVEVLAY
jgi:hypothetical protein